MKKKNPLNKLLLEASLQNNREVKAKESPLLGIDFGEKFSGLSFSPDGICAIPLKIIETKDLDSEIKNEIKKRNIKILVFGLPILPNSQENELCKKIKKYAKKWENSTKVNFINERYSSKIEKNKNKKKNRIDDLASSRILEFYLSSKENTL